MPPPLRSRAWLLLAASITLQLVILRSVRVLKHDHLISPPATQYLLRRAGLEDTVPHKSLLALPYADWYGDASPVLRPFIPPLLVVVLTFLFSLIGITASDFFCPNLSTIATFLGLSESTAGVTFLAFGNGSPDVFSTFAAMRGGTFGLAIGELIGAASFIISIVVGSIALIRPFHVPKHAFLRDVLFFTSAVIVLISVLHDGHLTLWESAAMVILYVLYVCVVVGGNWIAKRRRAKAARHDLGWERIDDDRIPSPHGSDTPLPSLTLPSPTAELPLPSSPVRPSARRHRSHNSVSFLHQHHPHPESPSFAVDDTPRANFSLLGAIEFRDVVNSLRASESRANSPSRSPAVGNGDGRERADYFGPVRYATHRRASSTQGFSFADPALGRSRSRPRAGTSFSASRQTSLGTPSAHAAPIPESSPSEEANPVSELSPDRHVSNPWSDQPGRPATPRDPGTSPAKPSLPKLHIPAPALVPQPPSTSNRHRPGVPSISVIDPSGHVAPPLPTPSPFPAPRESRFRVRRRTRMALRILFPSLQSFRHKSVLGMVLAVYSVPAILALTLTLPVVDAGQGSGEGAVALPVGEDEPLNDDVEPGMRVDEPQEAEEDRLLTPDVSEGLHHLVESGFSPLHSPLGRIHHSAMRRISQAGLTPPEGHVGLGIGVEGDLRANGVEPIGIEEQEEADKELLEEMEEDEALEFHKGLTAAQCVFGPTFCALIIFQETTYLWWVLLGCSVAGLVAAAAVLRFASDGSSQTWRLVRCFAGFVCSMVWIAAIADEVVSVLGALGEILGLSDAIIGLTIFAVGNSLADLVANVTVAQFAPAMAYAACFGGPMLNLLLGIGGSGTYHILSTPKHHPVSVHFSPTLWVSASGLVLMLVATALFVPWNGYLIDRKWAVTLIVAYICLMSANIAVEVKTGRN